jgi:DNA-binding NarL/FixJ family response regulator
VVASSLSTFAVHRSAVVAQAFHHQLGATPGLSSSGWAIRAADTLDEDADSPTIWIVDALLPHSGAAVLCDRLASAKDAGRMVVLAEMVSLSSRNRVMSLVERGVSGVVDVDTPWPTFIEAIHAVANGVTWVPPDLESDVLKSVLLARSLDDDAIRSLLRLTDRERQVLFLLCQGHTRVEVAEALNISTHTARTHVQRVIDKFRVHSQREVVALAMRHRLVERFEDA